MRHVRALSLIAGLVGCGSGLGPGSGDEVPLRVSATGSFVDASDQMTLEVTVVNTSDEGVMVKVRCTPIELDLRQDGQWRRIEDLRLCAPPNRSLVPARTTLVWTDVRQVAPGEWRVVVELADGRQAISAPFVVTR